ncbi:MAG: hypothetical protein R2822_08815 [Spirosomataceae bacterium]
MARPNLDLITALRRTAKKNRTWGCLPMKFIWVVANVVTWPRTQWTKADIHNYALANGRGDWNEQLNDYCPTSDDFQWIYFLANDGSRS